MNEERIIERLDAMVAAGRITDDEATRLRATVGTADFDDVLAGVRARHAQVHTDEAVAVGRLSSDEADGLLERVRGGEHSSELRRHIKDAH
jgi:polyhydroxyalkanoate synthesis regulator phasin